MGGLVSVIKRQIHSMLDLAIEHSPILYLRANDYNSAGLPRKEIQYIWDLSMKSMITNELATRKLIYPIIKTRVINIRASQKYTNAQIAQLLMYFPKWDERKVFDYHDLFQVFEVDGDGLIELTEMLVGLDNMGDTTSFDERLEVLCAGDSDGTLSIDFVEFLRIMYDLEINKGGVHPLYKTFNNIESNIKFIRHMSTIQQIQAGFI